MKISLLKLIIGIFGLCMFSAQAENSRYINLVDSADNYIKLENWQKAQETLIKALREEPANFHNSLLFSNLGIVKSHLNDYEGALEAFSLGLSIAPKSTVILNNRANFLMQNNEYDAAIEDLTRSLDCDSVQEWPLQMRALLYTTLGELEPARKDYEDLRKYFPENSSASLGMARIAELEGDMETADELYRESLQLQENDEVRSMYILLKIRRDKYQEAFDIIRESIALYPENPNFYIWRGYLNRLNYRYEEAEADKKMALAKGGDPKIIESYLQGDGR